MTWQEKLYKDHPMIAKELEVWINMYIITPGFWRKKEFKPKYFLSMEKISDFHGYFVSIIPRNGKELKSHLHSKSRLRNQWKKFADTYGLEWRE